MIYLFDQGFKNKSVLDLLVNQVKCPDGYKKCQCLSCKVKSKIEVYQGTCLACHEQSSFADDNDNVNDLRSSFANSVNYKDNDNDNDNDNDPRISFANNVNGNDNDLRSSFANKDNVIDNDLQIRFANNVNDNYNDNDNKDNFIYLFDEKHQKGKPNNSPTNNTNTISVNISEDLQSWLNDDNIITEATFPDNFRCIISGPSECGKTFVLMYSIYFDKLYIIRPTGDPYNGLERINKLSCLLKI